MFRKKKAPSVKIPASVLRREASKVAKKMIDAEKKKEKRIILREKAKAKASKKVSKKKVQQEEWDSFLDDHLKREIWGGVWIALAIILGALFLSSAPAAEGVTHIFKNIFGRGMWLLPLFFIGFGIALFLRSNQVFPPGRVIAFLCLFTSLEGLLNMLAPLNEQQALAHLYGGAWGFAIGWVPRGFLGDGVAWVIFLASTWLALVISFKIKITEVLKRLSQKTEETEYYEDDDKKNKINVIKPNLPEKNNKSVPEKKESTRFKNELEIIDSTRNQATSKKSKKDIDLTKNPEDELTEAKNRELGGIWEPPSLDLLKEQIATIAVDEASLREKANAIAEKLEQFGIEVAMKSVHVGPTVTQFTLEPSAGVKLNKITALKSDLTLALAVENLRIEAPIPGKKLVGIEIPNAERAIVSMREILESEPWEKEKSSLKLALGRDVSGHPVVADLAKMPHLLIAGKTGSGKSVAMNAFLVSLLWNNSPKDLRMILVDPKRVELAPYNHLPHLLTPVIVEPEKSVSALAWAVAEMNRRYKDFAKKGCRNISEHNEKNPEEKEPFIVIVIDELADLMMVAGKDVEAAICRIAQMARAVGMHLIVATQRPSVDVVTGLIKANLPARMSFKVSSGIDSRTIIDGIGAEDLLGFGDMLNLDGNSGKLTRVQGLYVSTEEVERITNNIKLQFPEAIGKDDMKEEITNQSIEGMAKGGVLTAGVSSDTADEDLDKRYEEAVDLVIETGKASASFLQRRLEVGYARAARLLDQMESRKIIGPSRGAKAREIYGRQESSD